MDDDDDDRVDLSALDPERDPARWEARILAAAASARAAARRRTSLSRTLAGYGIPAFALAAAAALAIWLLAPRRGAPAMPREHSSESDGLVGWALRGDPDGAGLLSSLGGGGPW
jgi:hypothetical protein